MIISALIEGMGINAVARLCRVSKVTVLRLLADVGQLCRDYHDIAVTNLPCKRIQLDECWSFVGCKQKSLERGKSGHGDVWTWVGICDETRLVVGYYVGNRDKEAARAFLADIAARILERVQITSDAHASYLDAIRRTFGNDVDYGQLHKIYSAAANDERQYSPAKCVGCTKLGLIGYPNPKHLSTSYVERSNLGLRTQNRRFTRLTNGFSKRLTNHEHAIALHYFAHNFIRKHQAVGTTPAVAAGLTKAPWTVTDLIGLLEDEERKIANGGRINTTDKR